MRHIRSVLRPANISLSRQFQWRQVINNSNATLRPVSNETSNLVHGTNMQWRGRSFAASAPSDEVRKPRRRVSKDERKSMVENYVNKYRAMNAGKFPTVTDAQKDVGGSYYVIRQILQELEYNSKISSVDAREATSVEKISVMKDDVSIDFVEASQTRELGELNPISKADSGVSSSMSFESKEEPQSSISIEESLSDETKLFSALIDKSKDVGTQSDHPIEQHKSSLHSDPENNRIQETVAEDKLQFDGLQPKAEPEHSTESEMSGRELHKVPTEGAEPQRESSMWQNLKSFANGIFGIWRRS